MKTKAAVLEAFKTPIVMREFETLSLAEGEVLLKILAAGVCGSDVHIQKGEDPRTPIPIILGHEGVGRIAALGGPKKDVSGRDLKEGDLVVFERGIMCGRCRSCVILKRPALCASRRTYGISVSSKDPPHLRGCYAEHIHLMASAHLIRIDAAVDPAVLVPATCSGATAANAFEQSGTKPGDAVVIVGPGPLGLFLIAMAKQAGAGPISVMGMAADRARLDLCRLFGADHTMVVDGTSIEDREAEVRKLTSGLGGDVVFECTGARRAAEDALHFAAPGGTVLIPGIATPVGQASVSFYEHLARWNVRLQGVWVSDTSHLRRAALLVSSGGFPFEKIVTHRFPLAQANEALVAVEKREAMKAVLIP